MLRGSFLLVTAILLAAASAVNVTISGRRLLVDGAPFFMKGVNYSPVPIGQFPGQTDLFANAAIYSRDIPLMADMGVNLIRLYGIANNFNAHKPFLDACMARGIRVAMGYWVTYNQNFADPAIRTQSLNEFVSMVRTYKSHGAVIMWLFGNEVNIPSIHNVPAFMSLLSEATQRAHAEEGASFRPVSSPLIDIDIINIVRTYPNAVDFWAAQCYRGRSFFTFFNEYAAASGKPLFMTEFGIDALDGRSNVELGNVHAEYTAALWSEIAANSAITSGGAVFSWIDEWWKGGDANTQSFVGVPNAGYPDQINNEAWYGMFRVQKNSNGADTLIPRPAVAALRNLYRQPSPITAAPDPRPTTAAPGCAVTTNTLRVTPSPATLAAGSTSVSVTLQFGTPAGVAKIMKVDLFTSGFGRLLGSREVDISCTGTTTVVFSNLNLAAGNYVVSAFLVNRATFLANPANAQQSALVSAQVQFTVTGTATPAATRAATSAACSAHSLCAGLGGDCCPTTAGLFLNCCSNRASADISPASSSSKAAALISLGAVLAIGAVAAAAVAIRTRQRSIPAEGVNGMYVGLELQ